MDSITALVSLDFLHQIALCLNACIWTIDLGSFLLLIYLSRNYNWSVYQICEHLWPYQNVQKTNEAATFVTKNVISKGCLLKEKLSFRLY